MFWQKKSIEESGVLQGWTDAHCHILPGVDDGFRSVKDSLTALKWYEMKGVCDVWLTPHIMEDIPNTPEELLNAFSSLLIEKEKENIRLNLHLAAEHMIDPLFVKRMNEGRLMLYGENSDMILVETSYVQPPMDFKNILRQILSKGIFPLLAHPERYMYMDEDDYYELQEMGVRFQLNLPSLAGAYGERVKNKANFLLNEEMYFCTGSDMHSLKPFIEAVERKSIKKSTIEKLKKI